MNGSIGSEFIQDFDSNNEKFLFFSSKRIFILWLSIFLGTLVTAPVLWFELPDIIYYVFDITIVTPMLFFGMSLDKRLEIKERYYFMVLETLRVYQTEMDEVVK